MAIKNTPRGHYFTSDGTHTLCGWDEMELPAEHYEVDSPDDPDLCPDCEEERNDRLVDAYLDRLDSWRDEPDSRGEHDPTL